MVLVTATVCVWRVPVHLQDVFAYASVDLLLFFRSALVASSCAGTARNLIQHRNPLTSLLSGDDRHLKTLHLHTTAQSGSLQKRVKEAASDAAHELTRQ